MYVVQLIYCHFRHSCCYNAFPMRQNNPQICHLPYGGSGPPPNTWFIWPTQVHNQNGISIASAVSLQLTILSPYTLQWGGTCPPQKWPFPCRDRDPDLIHGSLGQPKSTIQTTSQSVQPFLQGSQLCPTDTHICTHRDHTNYFDSNRPYLMLCKVMWPKMNQDTYT